MNQLSASASIVLSYARQHEVDGIAEIGDDLDLSSDSVVVSCKQLKSHGVIRDFKCSDDCVELVVLK